MARTPSDVELFLLDMDGTIYLGDRLFDCTKPFLETVRALGKRYLFLTNNSSKDRTAYVEKLARLGIDAAPDEVFTSGEATTRLLRRRMPGASVAVFGMPTLEREFREAGFRLVERDPDLVVLGFDQAFDYAKMTRLCDLVREGRPYVATHPDFNCPVDGGFIPDIGASIAYVKASTGREPDEVVGKPHAGIVDAIVEKYGVPKERICMVGDRLYTDIALGAEAGIATALVLSGETTAADAAASPFKPTWIFDDLSGLRAALASGDSFCSASPASERGPDAAAGSRGGKPSAAAQSRHRPIVGTLGFILSPDRRRVLMVHRTYRKTDENLGKYNGVGGHLERGEDVASCMVREIREETGLEVLSMRLRGTVCWSDFGPDKEEWLGFVFLVDGWRGEPFADNEEGTLSWERIDRLGDLPMWKGDRLFLPLVFDGDPRPFHGWMRYDGDEPAEWRCSRAAVDAPSGLC